MFLFLEFLSITANQNIHKYLKTTSKLSQASMKIKQQKTIKTISDLGELHFDSV